MADYCCESWQLKNCGWPVFQLFSVTSGINERNYKSLNSEVLMYLNVILQRQQRVPDQTWRREVSGDESEDTSRRTRGCPGFSSAVLFILNYFLSQISGWDWTVTVTSPQTSYSSHVLKRHREINQRIWVLMASIWDLIKIKFTFNYTRQQSNKITKSLNAQEI